MKSILKTSALPAMPSATFHPPAAPSEFGRGFQQYLASSSTANDESGWTGTITQPLRYLEAVPSLGETAATVDSSGVQIELSNSLGAALLLAARPTTQSLSLAKAVHALRHG
jgi:hypothetical protein